MGPFRIVAAPSTNDNARYGAHISISAQKSTEYEMRALQHYESTLLQLGLFVYY